MPKTRPVRVGPPSKMPVRQDYYFIQLNLGLWSLIKWHLTPWRTSVFSQLSSPPEPTDLIWHKCASWNGRYSSHEAHLYFWHSHLAILSSSRPLGLSFILLRFGYDCTVVIYSPGSGTYYVQVQLFNNLVIAAFWTPYSAASCRWVIHSVLYLFLISIAFLYDNLGQLEFLELIFGGTHRQFDFS